MEICTCHYKEDLEWLRLSDWPITIYHKEGGSNVPENIGKIITIPNNGVEASAYIQYIIQRYESLPDHVAFIHGHETSYHQCGDRPLLEMIRDANIKKYSYIPLNNYWYCFHTIYQLANYIPIWNNIFNIFPPNFFITCGGAQFVVSKKNILTHSKEYYEELYLKVSKIESAAGGIEFLWHIIFNEKFVFVPRDDHFNPPLKEFLYSAYSSTPMKVEHLKIGYCGKGPVPEGIIPITNNEQFDNYKNKCIMIFCFHNDEIYDIKCNDINKIARINQNDLQKCIQCYNKFITIFEFLYTEALKDNTNCITID